MRIPIIVDLPDLDGMPLLFELSERTIYRSLFFYVEWVCLSALHVIELRRELHTHISGPEILGIRAGLSVGLSVLVEVESTLL